MRRSTKILLLIAAVIFLFAIYWFARPATGEDAKPGPGGAAPAPVLAPDVFAEVLKDAGLDAKELGYRPKGTWARYPVTAPYRMPFFDDLLANPIDTYEFTRTLGNLVEDWLTPERLTKPLEEGKPGALYRLGTFLAFDRRIGGFRGFGTNLLISKPQLGFALSGVRISEDLLANAWLAIDPSLHEAWAAADTAEGMDRAVADLRKRLSAALGAIPEVLHPPLARLLTGLSEARGWIDLGLENVLAAHREKLVSMLPGLVDATPDAARYDSVVEQVAKEIDEHSLAYGCLKALEAVQRARIEIEAITPKGGWGRPFRVHMSTPFGDVQFDGDPTAVEVVANPFLVVDFEPRDARPGALGCTSKQRTLSVALLMREVKHVGSSSAPGEGMDRVGDLACGLLGCGILYSAGNCNTTYETRSWGLGAGMFGMGCLIDEGGDDVYRMREMGEGAGYFGAGLLLDAAGNDRYELLEGDGQGFAGPNGIGILADRSGNDHYFAEPLPEKAGKDRGDYHSDQKIVGSNAQGAGMGRRGDMTDGHAWAGGLGALIDIDGDDVYEAGNWCQGVGYWFGTGLLYDGGGNDIYRSVYFSHGSGAHFAVGAVIDEGGDDQHLLYDWPKVGLGPKAGAGIGFGWDVVNAFVIDRAGNDTYDANIISEGCGEIRSNGWLIDEGGDDTYVMDEGALGFGAVDEQPYYSKPDRVSPFDFHIPQLGLLIDCGGADKYLRRNAKGELVPDATAGDGKAWGRDAPRGPGGAPNTARGRDVARGRIGWLDAWARRGS